MRAFVEKTVGFLREGIHLLVIDLFPPGPRTAPPPGQPMMSSTSRRSSSRVRPRISSGAAKFIKSEQQQLDETQRNFKSLSERFLDRQKHRIDLLQERVKNLSPENVLKRGYAMIKKNEQLVVSAKQIEAGDKVQIIMHDGEINSTVSDIKS